MKYLKLHISQAETDESADADAITHEFYSLSRFDLIFNHDPENQKWVTVQLKDPAYTVNFVVKVEVGEFYKCTKIIE